jgi:DNA ligase (NAD+)
MNDEVQKQKEKATEEVRRLADLLFRYNRAYYVEGKPEVSDTEYDRLFLRLQELEEQWPELKREDSPTLRVGSDLSSDFPEVEHRVPVLSLDKAYSVEELLGWMGRTSGREASGLSFVVEEKIDGVSIVLYYRGGILERAVTRGNGYVGNDVTDNVRTIGSVPLRLTEAVDIAVRGEIYLPKASFESLNRKMGNLYVNPRNLAAGTLRRVKSREVAEVPLTIFVYEGFFSDGPKSHLEILEYLQSLGFRTNRRVGIFTNRTDLADFSRRHPDWQSGTWDELEGYVRTSTEERGSLDYEIDGLVVKINELDVRDRLGYTGHHPRWAIAYKFESPTGTTIIKSIDIQVGRTGRITPVARVEPVFVGGSTISNVTLHNQDYVDMLEIAVGDQVSISRRGDVIPAVEEVVAKNESGNPVWNMPLLCPSCGSSLQKKGAHTFCLNPSCPDQVRGRLFFFIAAGQMDIDGLGPETVDLMIREGFVSEPADLYRFDYERLLSYPGFGEKKIEAIRRGLTKSLTRPFHTVLASVGIPEMGKKVVELLISAGFRSMKAIYALVDQKNRDALIAVKGIGEKTVDTIFEELGREAVRKRIDELAEVGLAMEEEEKLSIASEQLIFAGQSWCVTGSFQHFNPRGKAMELVSRFGGSVVSSVSGKTSHLLAGEGGGSKLTKARSLGVEVLSEEEFLDLLASAGIEIPSADASGKGAS